MISTARRCSGFSPSRMLLASTGDASPSAKARAGGGTCNVALRAADRKRCGARGLSWARVRRPPTLRAGRDRTRGRRPPLRRRPRPLRARPRVPVRRLGRRLLGRRESDPRPRALARRRPHGLRAVVRQLDSADLALVRARSRLAGRERRRTSRRERALACRDRRSARVGADARGRGAAAGALRGAGVRGASAPGRVRGLGERAQGRALGLLLRGHGRRVARLWAPAERRAAAPPRSPPWCSACSRRAPA